MNTSSKSLRRELKVTIMRLPRERYTRWWSTKSKISSCMEFCRTLWWKFWTHFQDPAGILVYRYLPHKYLNSRVLKWIRNEKLNFLLGFLNKKWRWIHEPFLQNWEILVVPMINEMKRWKMECEGVIWDVLNSGKILVTCFREHPELDALALIKLEFLNKERHWRDQHRDGESNGVSKHHMRKVCTEIYTSKLKNINIFKNKYLFHYLQNSESVLVCSSMRCISQKPLDP